MKNLNLRIRADGSIHVSAPSGVPLSRIEAFIMANSAMIVRSRERREKRETAAPMPENFTDGEKLCFKGKILILRIRAGKKNRAELRENELVLRLRMPEDPESRRKLFDSWMLKETKQLMEAVCGGLWEKFSPPLRKEPEIKFRRMRSKWGCCRPDRKIITFNSRLAALPEDCAEYVAVHEFCHFLSADHSPEFYRHLKSFMPDYREKEKVLSNYALVPL